MPLEFSFDDCVTAKLLTSLTMRFNYHIMQLYRAACQDNGRTDSQAFATLTTVTLDPSFYHIESVCHQVNL